MPRFKNLARTILLLLLSCFVINSASARFMGVDPAEVDTANIHSFNRYAYANNNPYRFVDPDGRSPLVAVAVGVILWTGFEMLPGPNVPWNSGVVLPTTLPDMSAALKGVGLAAGLVGSMKQAAIREALEASAGQANTKGVSAFEKSVEAVRNATGKGNNITVNTQQEAEAILEKARPGIPWRETYGPKSKVGKEVHPVDGSGNAPGHNQELPHIKWRDWSGGKSAGAEGHIYFRSANGEF